MAIIPTPALQSAHSQSASAPGDAGARARGVIGVAVLAICVVLGGGVIWWYFFGSTPSRSQVRVDPKEQTLGFAGGRRGRRVLPRTIDRLDANAWLVRGSAGQMSATQKDGVIELGGFSYVGGLGVSQEQMTMLAARWRILRDPAMAKAWGITAEQKSRLNKVKGAGGLDPSAQQRSDLQVAFVEYQHTPEGPARVDAERKILDQLDAIASASFPASRKAYAERADQIRKILTKEQIRKVMKR